MDLDKVTSENFPLIAAPLSGVIPLSTKQGVRYVAASNGLWRAIDKSWLRTQTPLAVAEKSVIPYGSLRQEIEFFCSMPPMKLWREFAALAKASLPNEVAAAMVWDSTLDEWRLAARESITANGGYVSYREVELEDGEELIVDLHSHGHHPAYFSEIDNNDDFGSIKIAAVMGCVGSESTEIVARLILIDKTIDLVITSSGGWAIVEKT